MFWGVEIVSEGRLFNVEVQFVLSMGFWRLPSPSLGSGGGPSPFEGGSPRHFDSDAQAVSKTPPFQAPPQFPRQARNVSASAEYSWEAILGYPGYRGPMGSEIHFWLLFFLADSLAGQIGWPQFLETLVRHYFKIILKLF